MKPSDQPQSAALVIFGVSGDLAWRKLVPALFDLALDDLPAENLAVIGVGRSAGSDDKLRARLKNGVRKFSRAKSVTAAAWRKFARNITYLRGDATKEQTYRALAKRLHAWEKQCSTPVTRVYYLATPPALFEVIPRQLAKAGLVQHRERDRVVVEKPFGHDADSAAQLNTTLTRQLRETQLFRIDHFLGKETVQNLLAFRFANPMFEPVWNHHYVDYVTITVAEQLGVENRAAYFDPAGTLRDMVQNHLLQLLCLVAMEPMPSLAAEAVRDKTLDVLRAVRPIPAEAVNDYAARGQYGPGWIEGRRVPGYRAAPGVAADSQTETFAAVKLWLDNWRWSGVPFYLRTGKRLALAHSEISIHFRATPHRVFPLETMLDWQPARLMILLPPDEGILLRFQAKQPGPGMHLRQVHMQFRYAHNLRRTLPNAYETLLLDILKNDPTLFMRFDHVAAAWRILQPVLDVWAASPAADFPNYAAGSWGPSTSAALLAKAGHVWPQPTRLTKTKP